MSLATLCFSVNDVDDIRLWGTIESNIKDWEHI